MMDIIRNHMRLEAERAQSQVAKTRVGTVMSYDPAKYAAKVSIQPEGILSGWLPVKSPWVGNGWGLFAPPSIGDQVEVEFLEGGFEAGTAGLRFYSVITKPLPAPSGEFWLVHQSQSTLRFTNDGKVQLTATADLNINVGGNTNMTSTGNVTMTTPVLVVNGAIQATGDITDYSGTTNESMAGMRSRYDSHVHPGVMPGGSDTGLPTPLE